MFRADARKPARFCDELTRRDFLQAGALAPLGLGLSGLVSKAQGATNKRDVNCILLFLVGGPSQLDTWDMKPDAPEGIRGPFRPIATNVPGIQISEIFPRLATMMDRVALVRGVHHEAAPVHDTGHQLLQTGRLFSGGIEHPHIGCVLSKLKGPNGDLPPHVLLPRPIGPTGGSMPHGQTAGYLGKAFDPFVFNADPSSGDYGVLDRLPRGSTRASREAFNLNAEPDALRDRYGLNPFGQNCLMARRLVERGVRFVTVNMYETVFNEVTWDIHGSAPFSSMECYKTEVGPTFDNAYTALLDDLRHRGLLDSTMVLAFGEFGRTPKINQAGGRDHHPGCWTVLFAGGAIQGGQVVGSSDENAAAPRDRPVSAAEIAATVYQGLGLSLDTELQGPDGQPLRLVDAGVKPVHELF
jgi:uncharacterized protein (DUF1501 family)